MRLFLQTWMLSFSLFCLTQAPQEVSGSGDSNAPHPTFTGGSVLIPTFSGIAASATTMTSQIMVMQNDDDQAGIIIARTSGLSVSEDGTVIATFEVNAQTAPFFDVTVPLTFSTSLVSLDMGTVTLPASSTQPLTVTVTGLDNDIADGDTPFVIVTEDPFSSDPAYDQLTANDVDDVTGMVIDDDTAGIRVSPDGTEPLVTTETGGTASFSVVLTSEPAQAVSVGIMSTASDEGTVPIASLTFEPIAWDTPQMVTVTGVDDDVDDGDKTYSIVTKPAKSADPGYAGFNPEDISLVNTDDGDTAGFSIQPTNGLETTEEGGTDSFEVVLNSEPIFNVHIPFHSNDLTEGTITDSEGPVLVLVFTSANWNQPQTIFITGLDDDLADGDTAYSIVSGDPASNDLLYDAFTAKQVPDIAVINLETPGKQAGVEINQISNLLTSEAGTTKTFQVRLTTEPLGEVLIPFSSSDPGEAIVAPQQLVFTPANWNLNQTITITGIDDNLIDDDQNYTIVSGDPTSSDPVYEALSAADIDHVMVTNANGDFCDPVSVVCNPDGPMAITGTPGCFIDIFDGTDADTVDEWILIAQGLEIPQDGTLLVTGFAWEADKVYLITGAGNTDLILNRYLTVPTLNHITLPLFAFLLMTGAIAMRRRQSPA